MDPAAALRLWTTRFRAEGTARSAAGQKAYLKSELKFFGVTTPQLRAAARELCKKEPDLDARALVDAAFATEWWELRSASLAVLEHHQKKLRAADADWLIALIRRARTWAQVDWIAVQILGPLVAREPSLGTTVRRWARDEDFWVRRTALLVWLLPLRTGEGEFARFAELAEPMLEEKEFFIRKAIGWVLRETSKKQPKLVFDFLKQHRARVSGLTLREGARRLPVALRKQL
jgi:3-methyladenine DNA glycosylase AlkD